MTRSSEENSIIPGTAPAPKTGSGGGVTDAAAAEVRRRVLEQGFDRVGFALAGPAPHADRLREWLDRGYAGSMDYIARGAARRSDPRQAVPGARTVIAAALHYHGRPDDREREEDGPESGAARGIIASYAQGADYHRVMETRLRAACRALAAAHPGHRFRYYVDTGPVLERSWAEKAGIGWIGKNTCAIDPERGSFFFIGVIITTLEIAPDPPSANHCGSCRLCIDACPTAAIVEPYRLDARRCISYLTIEERGPVPEEFRESTGAMVFGCDICQDVCPFNRTERLEGDPELEPRPENRFPPLAALAAIASVEEYRARFPRSAVRRAPYPVFLRNVIIACANSGRREMVPVLENLAGSPAAADPAVAELLRWALERLREPSKDRSEGAGPGVKSGDPKGI